MKIIISLAIVTALGLTFTGCSVKMPTTTLNKDKVPSYNTLHHPKLDEIATAEIGANIYSKTKLFINNTYDITLKETAIGKSQYASINYDVNTNPPLTSTLMQWNEPYGNTLCGVGTVWQVCLTDEKNTGSFTHVANIIYGSYGKLDKPAKYEIKPSIGVPKKDSFKYEALYQGKQGNKIKVSFREFSLNETSDAFMIRPAFTQDIDYELNKNGTTIIGFKGLRIEVLKATNMDITYKVIKDYD
jgi:hypothetical protein